MSQSHSDKYDETCVACDRCKLLVAARDAVEEGDLYYCKGCFETMVESE